MIHSSSAQLDALKRRLTERADALGVSLRAASKQAGLAYGYAGDLVAGRNKSPTVEKLSALAGALDCDLEYLLGSQELPRRIAAGAANDGAATSATARRIPVYRSNQMGDGQAERIDSAIAPPALAHVPGAYAVIVTNDLNSPRYEVGECVHVHPGLPVKPGDYVVARLVTGEMAPARLISMGVDEWVFERTKEHERVSIPTGEVQAVHRIVGTSTV